MIPGNSRRSFLKFIPGSALALFAVRVAKAGILQDQPPARPPRNLPIHPQGNGQGNGPLGTAPGQAPPGEGIPSPAKNAPTDNKTNPLSVPRRSLTDAQKDMRQNVEQLARIAEDLKREVEKTDSTKVLSVDLVRKSEEIEKLAHHIAALAKG